ncbi:homeobox-DDT domain protein RLT2 isoform X2 [Dendrobium catenatum]|uniref:Homeobox-DDT domain protein RLT3 n=1 Tax=Dendrobium catenatum TaxID=906689 RepID=A0A2I0XE38_9ASPA|nr:homeobox-DDT domain protein RLT2 isoform X2 [Dendrobium catenatum]PKU86172.1 hypothetical protein MA16_Dca002003 [Dendrobium catenatum]
MEFGEGGGGGSPRVAVDGVPKQQAKRKMKTPSQIDVLEKAYTVSSRLSEQMRQELAQKTELSSREISMWFANKRFQGKQAHLPREPKKEEFSPLPLHSSPNGGGSGFVLAACHFMDSDTNESSIREVCSKLTRPKPAAPQLKKKTQLQHMMSQQQPSHEALDPLVLTFMERKLGGRLREDGPLVGVNFDPLPPGAFGSPLCGGNETVRKLKQPTRAPKGKSILKQNAGSSKVSSVFQRTDSSCMQNPIWRMPIDEVGSSVNLDSVHNLGSKLPCFSSGKQHPQKKEMHPSHSLQDAQFTIYPVNDIVDKFVLTDTLTNDVTSQMERLHKSKETQTTDKVEVLDRLVACEKQCIKRKSEVQALIDKEMYDHERHNGEAVILERRSNEVTLQYVDQPVCYKKALNKVNMEEEKVRQQEELQLGTTAMEEAVNKTFIAHGNIQGNMQLIEDEQLELMKLAASSKGLPSINLLDNDTLDTLHSFQDMLGAFPPESVLMKRPFAVPPWTDSDENVGNLLMVWKFLVTFAGDFGLWPFTLEEFAQALHDQDSRLLGEIHVALLKYIIRDLDDVKNARAYIPCGIEDNSDKFGITFLNIVDGAQEWGFDIHFWKSKLNFLTWPEILRQFALSAGFGTKLKKAGYACCHGDKNGVNAGDRVASLDKNVGGSNSALVQQKDKSSSCDSSYQLTTGTLEFAVFHTLLLIGSEGLTPVEVADYIKEHRLYDLTTIESAHTSINSILAKDAELFERVGSITYRVKPCFGKDPSIVEKILNGATKSIQLYGTSHFAVKLSDRNFEDLGLADRDEDFGDSFDEHPLGGKFTSESSCDLNSTKVSTSLNKSTQYLHPDEPGLINETGFENVDGVSLLFLESAEDENFLSMQNDEFFESIHEVSSASGDVKNSEQFSESWVQELIEGEYSSLSTEERLKVLVALVGVVVEGNSFHIFIEERLKEAQASKKMMLAKMRLDRKLHEEVYGIMDDSTCVHANPKSFNKQAPDLCRYSTLNDVSSQKKELGQQFSSNSSCILPEPLEHAPASDLSQLELYIDRTAEMLHPFRFLPLGLDRRHNRYWQFSTSSSRNDPGSGRIFFESKDGFWRVIDSDEAFDALLAVLDTHGIRESHLCFMLKRVEIMFKDTTKRRKSREFYAESTTDTLQTTLAPDSCTANHNISSISVLPAYDTIQSSASLKIDLVSNEESSASKKYLNFMKWMWEECFNPRLLCAMRYGTKRCLQLLETCHICYQPYLADERHCASCHLTFGIPMNGYEDFSEHVGRCEADFKLQISIPFIPISIQLLKAQLAIIEASIPMEAFHPLWDDSYRKSWGIKLKLSSSAREIFQSLTILENAIKPDCLCPDFVTTNELLSSETDFLGNTSTEAVRLIPWIPETTSAVALRLLDLDCSIPYMLQHGREPLEGTEAGEFLVLPRSTVVEPAHQVESAISDNTDDQNGGQGFHTVENCLHQEPGYDGGGQRSCTNMQNIIHGEDNSDLEDFSSSGNSDEVEINFESSDSLQGVKIPATWSYKTNAESANIYSKAGVMDDEDEESAHKDEFGGGEAVESNECHRWQETVNSYFEGYLDEQESEGRNSKIVLEQLEDRWDVKNSRWEIAFSTKSADGEENSSSVNTK